MINSIDLNNAMTRTNDYLTIKHNEDVKGSVDQSNFQQSLNKEVELKLSTVERKDDAELAEKRFDAKEKGSNEYQGNGGQNRKKKEQPTEKMTVKGVSHFDMSI